MHFVARKGNLVKSIKKALTRCMGDAVSEKSRGGAGKLWKPRGLTRRMRAAPFSFGLLASARGGSFSLRAHREWKPHSLFMHLPLAWKPPYMRWALLTCPTSSPTRSLSIASIGLLVWQSTVYHKHTRVCTHACVHMCTNVKRVLYVVSHHDLFLRLRTFFPLSSPDGQLPSKIQCGKCSPTQVWLSTPHMCPLSILVNS